MPIYMDSHIVPGVEAKHAAEAHKKDLGIQNQFGCRNLTYWIDEHRGRVFCLIDAPNEEAVRQMHDHAHGLVPHEIIPVNGQVVEAFLGRIADPEPYFDPSVPGLKIFNDPAFRVILAIKTKDERLLLHNLGKNRTKRLFSLYYDTVREQIQKHEGSEVEMKGEVFVVSFTSVSLAVDCVIAIQKALHVATELIDLRMGLHAGLPVDQSNTIFGKTVQFAQYLCTLDHKNQIIMSSIVSDLYKPDLRKNENIQDNIKRLGASEEKSLEHIIHILDENWQKPEFGIEDFCEKLSISRSQLYRKCTGFTNKSPNALLREYRLLKSLELLGKEGQNVSQTTFDAGFNSPSYFIKCFQKRFGLLPLKYAKLQT
ncbi:AraC-like DNA-binding protein [Flavobacteriaceae bacterium MAR_2009_75]|nr:AraC-like DNA-binding protein [Flavobacteriaceae bacterium MAR_2009_75]